MFLSLLEPLQTSRDDEEYLDRAIEEVSSVGIDQIAIGFDHLDGLEMLEMDDEEEMRQMISAATNLISMSGMQGFLSNHDQDYSAMPSPMMS
jgi:microsomal dipeptidase-like Zn-dependent dipeptidase